jgi:hypothetical protein
MRADLDERFNGEDLERDVWFPYYLPHWSSRAESAATYTIQDGQLTLSVPPAQPAWCADLHDEPLRVSCIQSASLSGQQPFKPGLVVREEHPPFWGYTPHFGQLEITMRGTVSPRSMFAFWLSGIEDRPERSGEVCVAEIFGDAISDGSAEVGMGVHQFRDPALREEFATERLAIDVSELHTYAVDWRPESVAFAVDGEEVRRLNQAPDYPLQLMIGVFDFPAKAAPGDDVAPSMVVTSVRGLPPVVR